jgi:hypothetical protein
VTRGDGRSAFAPALVLTVTLVLAAALVLVAGQLLVVHPRSTTFAGHAGLINQQRQTVKTDAYLISFLVLLPLALIFAPRLADAIAAGPNGEGLGAFAALACGSLAAALIVVRLSGGLPWGSGVKGILVGVLAWWAVAVPLTWRVVRGGRSAALHWLAKRTPAAAGVAALMVFGVLLCLSSNSLRPVPLVLGAAAATAAVLAYGRLRLPSLGRREVVLDLTVAGILLLAITDVVVFHRPSGIPVIYVDPGIVQFQQDWILGPTNQLLGGGALLVHDPVSQYGVGLVYFLAAWFKLARIGYGTFGFLDGLLTALLYIAGYAVLRVAGVRRTLAMSAIALGVLAFIYNFSYPVGQLPEEGPLRFGLPMIVLLGTVVVLRFPGLARIGRLAVLCALGVSAVWALEGFAYTTVTYSGVIAAQASLRTRGDRGRWLLRQIGLAITAWVAAHVILALATLAGTGQLPAWGRYLAYVRAFLLGGRAGSITFGFASWSPGLAAYGGAIASAAGIVLLARRRAALASSQPVLVVALAGATAYSIALLSYTDNRSSTYLFLYVALPLLIAGTLWLALIMAPDAFLELRVRRRALAGALAVSVLLVSGAWPSMSSRFSWSALAHAYPGGGLRAALHRLWHPPPIDPRSVEGIALLRRYIPGRRVIILLPTLPDLGTEILLRDHRYNLLPIGDPKQDSLVPSVWLSQMRAALARLRPGQRILIDRSALKIVADLRRLHLNPLTHEIDGGQLQTDWILRSLDRSFQIRPLARSRDGLIVAELALRRAA